MDLASSEGMKFMILSFNDGCMLSEHRAPGMHYFLHWKERQQLYMKRKL